MGHLQWENTYPHWLSPHDTQNYLIDRWDVYIDADYVQITSHNEDPSGLQLQNLQNNHIGCDSSGSGSVGNKWILSYRLKVPDLIEGS